MQEWGINKVLTICGRHLPVRRLIISNIIAHQETLQSRMERIFFNIIRITISEDTSSEPQNYKKMFISAFFAKAPRKGIIHEVMPIIEMKNKKNKFIQSK